MALSLFRKYRPETFADVVGQEHIVNTLQRAIASNNTADAYLFSGPRGTGKTSTARLVAKALLCEHPENGEPDNSCAQCREIADGLHPDVYELDAASRTGVDNVREEIINRVAFAPIRGRYKIYIIDEVHMLSTAAFNALLKTLEEPPTHIKFILCTTDPFRVPQTIQSRCQRFDFHRLSNTQIVGALEKVCQSEGYEYEPAALLSIAAQAQGGMRDALVALEQIAVFGGGRIELRATESLLGQIEPERLRQIAQAVASRDVAGCFLAVAELVESGSDITQFARGLTRHLRNLYLATQLSPSAADSLDWQGQDPVELAGAAQRFGSADRLAACLRLAADLNQQLKGNTDDRLALELALVRMAHPGGDISLEALADRITALEDRQAAAGVTLPPVTSYPAATNPLPATTATGSTVSSTVDTRAQVNAAVRTTAGSGHPSTAIQPQPVTAAEPAGAAALASAAITGEIAAGPPLSAPTGQLRSDSDAQRLWSAVQRSWKDSKNLRLLSLVSTSQARLDSQTQGLLIELPSSAGFTLNALRQPENLEVIQQTIQQVQGAPVALSWQLGFADPESWQTAMTSVLNQAADRDAERARARRQTFSSPAADANEPAAAPTAPIPPDLRAESETVLTTESVSSANGSSADHPPAAPEISAEPAPSAAPAITAQDLLSQTFGDAVRIQPLPADGHPPQAAV